MSVEDYKFGRYDRRSAPGFGMEEVTPADGADLAHTAKALRVFNTNAAAKEITFVDGLGATVTLKCPPGLSHVPCIVARVKATGTDVSDLEIHAVVD